MKYIGIDFGAKKVGVAIGDSEAGVAFPKSVLPNDKFLLGEIKSLLKNNNSNTVVMGESQDGNMKDNPIMQNARNFGKLLQSEGIEVFYEPEFMTSQQARVIQGAGPLEDASAAAIILQSYLDKLKK